MTRVIDDVPRTPAGSQGTRDPLQAPPPAFDLGDAARIADEVFGLSGSLTPLASERDLNFRVDAGRGSFLLKLHNPADDEALIDFQTQALLRVARVAADLPVMRVVPTRDGSFWRTLTGPDGRASVVRLFTFLDGHNAATEELGEGALFEWGATAARLGVALRGLFHAAAGYEIQWDVRRAPGLRRRRILRLTLRGQRGFATLHAHRDRSRPLSIEPEWHARRRRACQVFLDRSPQDFDRSERSEA